MNTSAFLLGGEEGVRIIIGRGPEFLTGIENGYSRYAPILLADRGTDPILLK
jgi:hypothetical protein